MITSAVSTEVVCVLGRGRLGGTLQEALGAAGIASRSASARDLDVATAAAEGATLVLLAVPDGMILPVAAELARLELPAATAFAHLSGAHGLDVLGPLAERHAVGSFHPFQPFATRRTAAAFHGATVGIAADGGDLRARLAALAEALGAHAHEVPDGHRALYHAAAVMASTYVVTLAAQARGLLLSLGWSDADALDAIVTLLRSALENLERAGVPDALSGPLRRGDAATVATHLRAFDGLAAEHDPSPTYRALGLASTALAVETGLDPTVADEITRLLRAGADA